MVGAFAYVVQRVPLVSAWIESALRDAVSALGRSGEHALAESLTRLLNDPQIGTIQLFRNPEVEEVANAISGADDYESFHDELAAVARAFGAAHCTVHCIRERKGSFLRNRVVTTFPREWIARYVQKRYSAIDPVVSRCLGGTGLFFWDEIGGSQNPIVTAFMREAAQHGVGPSGITFSAVSTQGDSIAVSLASTRDPVSFRHDFAARLSDFVDLAGLMVEEFSGMGGREVATPTLTSDQLKVLRAVASGKTLAEIGSWQLQSGSAGEIGEAILSALGARTVAQAVALAVKRSLLEDLPYFEEDIFIADPAREARGAD